MGTVCYTVIDGEVISENRNGVVRDYWSDPLGNTLGLQDSTGAFTDTFDYFPSGTVAARTGTTPTPFQWVGNKGYYRDNAKRVHVRARNFYVNLGRWAETDPIGFDGGDTNLYRYVKNRFVVMIDPSGLKCRLAEKGKAILKTSGKVADLDASVAPAIYAGLAGFARTKVATEMAAINASIGNFDALGKGSAVGAKDDPLAKNTFKLGWFLFFVQWDVIGHGERVNDPKNPIARSVCGLYFEETLNRRQCGIDQKPQELTGNACPEANNCAFKNTLLKNNKDVDRLVWIDAPTGFAVMKANDYQKRHSRGAANGCTTKAGFKIKATQTLKLYETTSPNPNPNTGLPADATILDTAKISIDLYMDEAGIWNTASVTK